MVDGQTPPRGGIRRLAIVPSPEKVALDLIRSIVGHADGHEVAAIAKIRSVLRALRPGPGR